MLPTSRLDMGDKPVPRRRGRRPLTKRQLLVVRLWSEGRTTDEIALKMGVSRNTVRSHRVLIFAKLGAKDRAHAVAIAMREGLLD